MPKTNPPTLVRDIAGLPDEVLAELHRRFGFAPGFNIQFMSVHLHTAAVLYWWFLPAATAKQKAKQLQRIEKLTNQLLDALGGESVAFLSFRRSSVGMQSGRSSAPCSRCDAGGGLLAGRRDRATKRVFAGLV